MLAQASSGGRPRIIRSIHASSSALQDSYLQMAKPTAARPPTTPFVPRPIAQGTIASKEFPSPIIAASPAGREQFHDQVSTFVADGARARWRESDGALEPRADVGEFAANAKAGAPSAVVRGEAEAFSLSAEVSGSDPPLLRTERRRTARRRLRRNT